MIKIIIALAFLCAAIFLGPRLADSQGFVHIATNNYIIETSVTTALIIAVISFLVLHFVLNVLFSSIHLPSVMKRWFGANAAKRRLRLQNEAFVAFEEGSYARALSLLKQSGKKRLPTHCLFLGAKCAFESDNLEACRDYLDQAERRKDTSLTACKLLRAKLNLRLDNVEAALENLESLEKDSYSSALITRLLYRCYEKEGDYAKINELLPNLKHLKLFDETTLEHITLNCLAFQLSNTKDPQEVMALVDKLSRNEKNKISFMLPVVKQLLKLNASDKATRLVSNLMKSPSPNEANEIYGALAEWPEASDSLLQLLLSKSSDTNGDNAPLLMALANLEMRSEKLEDAKSHVEKALELAPSREGYMLAAEVNKRTNNTDEANKYLSLALEQHE